MAHSRYAHQKWYNSSPPRRTSDSFLVRADRERLRIPLKDLKPPSVRSFFLIDRFSQSENIFYISNNMLVKKPDKVSHWSSVIEYAGFAYPRPYLVYVTSIH
jgi:hypothetical protein